MKSISLTEMSTDEPKVISQKRTLPANICTYGFTSEKRLYYSRTELYFISLFNRQSVINFTMDHI